ncbi:biopolymer transporter ExbD [Rhodovulum sp. 12E13]|uniref:biopolymer transporter ExbD n=1 Tax=Rhodovulum sp. 12E13 TaxID=2203891 RepID=UPI000E1A3B61|nr:biopolymer transporter ExbD [Rhodovulum sp. 12E13]RDC74048.1 biopolymer transporter ExbD [Rhodovulum sp. 12E13]
MRIPRPPARPRPDTIVPLIDVAFFLLVFFLLAGRMDATAPFEVTPPEALAGADMPGGGATLSVAADGALALDGVEIAAAGLDGAVAARLDARPGLFFRVNAHREAELRHVLPLVARLEALGARDAALVVTPDAGAR